MEIGFEAVEANLRAALAVFARAHPEGETRAYPGVAAACSGFDYSMFNTAVLTAPVERESDLEIRIKIAASYYASRKLPWSLWVCRDWLAKPVRGRLEDVCYRNFLHLVVEMPALAAVRLAPPVRALPELRFRPVADARTRAGFTHLMMAVYAIPSQTCRGIYESEKTWARNFAGYVGYLDSEPVTSAAVVSEAGVAGVYAVATLAAHRRKGYGEAAVRHALEQTRIAAGVEATVLESSESGYR
ncbi:MAG: GNAT family N-acetyltransferase, partial [Bryobacteraceae bacterium]